MGQDKKQLIKLLAFVKEIYENPENKDFATGIQALVLNDIRTGKSKEEWTAQINEIYELCLKKNLRDQAEVFYKDFPRTDISAELVEHYVKMEDARRANDFNSFGRSLFLQIELIVNTLLKDADLIAVYDKIRTLPPLTRYDKNTKKSYRTHYTQTKEKEDGTPQTFVKDTVDKYILTKTDNIGKPVSDQTTLDRCRIVLYTVCYKATISAWPKEDFEVLSGIYNVRNHESHSGAAITEMQESYYQKLIENKSQTYFRFLAFLLDFTRKVTQNYPLPESVKAIAESA